MNKNSVIPAFLLMGSLMGYANGSNFNNGLKGIIIGALVGGALGIFVIIVKGRKKQ